MSPASVVPAVAATRTEPWGPGSAVRASSRAAGSRVPAGAGTIDGVGQAEEPGGAGQGVVGVGAADEADAGAVCLAGQEQGELVGFGAAGGDEGVARRRPLCARARVTRASSSEAAGAWSQESRDGLRALAARSAAVATARGGQCRWAAQRGSAGSAAPSARACTRVRRASGSPSCGRTSPAAARTRAATASGPPAGRGPPRARAPAFRASRTVSSSGRRASGPSGPEARAAVCSWRVLPGARAEGVPACTRMRARARKVRRSEPERVSLWCPCGARAGVPVAGGCALGCC